MDEREAVHAALSEHIYGPAPPGLAVRIDNRRSFASSAALVEQVLVFCENRAAFHMLVLRPPERENAPLILVQVYCGLRAAFAGRPQHIARPLGHYPWTCRCGCFDPAARLIFGRFINAPPAAQILRRGFGLALLYGGDVVADHAQHGRPALARLGAAGAISAWAWAYSRALDALAELGGVDVARVAVWGQSRQGKAALLASARDRRFAATIALQSGRGGDALTAHRRGESVRHITTIYPHWFAPRFAYYHRRDPPVDQDGLLGLIAPRPLLLGHAKQDRWADPEGAELALKRAHSSLAEPPQYWRYYIRPGWHGITDVDWGESLDFLTEVFAVEPRKSRELGGLAARVTQ
jgi:hypothetical protein